MKTIHKYPCPAPGALTSELVSNGTVIHVGLDPQNNPCFWVELDTDFNHAPVDFFVVGTGWELPESEGLWAFHTGSWVEGPFVWHLYRWIDIKYVGQHIKDRESSE